MISKFTITGDDGSKSFVDAIRNAEREINAEAPAAKAPVMDDDEALLRDVMGMPGGSKRESDRAAAIERADKIFNKTIR
jgi:hypothetical protein